MNKEVCERNILRLTNRLALLTFFFCVFSGVKAQTNNLYVYLSNGHYLAHYGNEVTLALPVKVGNPINFNPNTCLWESVSTGTNSNFYLRVYGTESLSSPLYLNVEAATTYYNAMVSTAKRELALNYLRSWPATLIGASNNTHFFRHHSTYGWIAVQEGSDAYAGTGTGNTSCYTPVTITNAGSYQGPEATITGASELTGLGTYNYSASPTITTVSYNNYYFNNANHYWYDNSDHLSTPAVDWSGTLTSTWSIDDNGGCATIDADGNVTVNRIPATNQLLTLRLTVTDGTRTSVFIKYVILRGGHYVIKDDLGNYMSLSGTAIGASTTFHTDYTVWDAETNSSGLSYTITSGGTKYYLIIANWQGSNPSYPTEARVTTNFSEWNCRWLGTDPDYLKSAGNYYIYRNSPVWSLTQSAVEHRVIAYPIIIERSNVTTVSAVISGNDGPITVLGNYPYTATPDVNSGNCDAYTFDGSTHYWFDGSDHGSTAPETWGEITASDLTQTWSLDAGAAGYATVNSSTGELNVTALPTDGPIFITLTCTISHGSNSLQVQKSIRLGEGEIVVHSLSEITDPAGEYRLAADFSTSGTAQVGGNGAVIGTSTTPFTGLIDGHLVTIIGTWNQPLFDYVEDATIKNVIIQNVDISSGTNVGAIAGNAQGETRIYNCGILSGSVGGTAYTGGLVGLLDGTAHVVNCFSYADITGGTDVGGIVGYNNQTTTAASMKTMVMNCMFYGDIKGGTNKSPVYGGTNIANLQGGLNTFNYYAYEQLPTSHITSNKYNSALAVEEKYLNRFEFYRLLLNSNKKLAAFYATGSVADADQKMAKWVLETADRTITNPKPYPILKAQGRYPSIINPDIANAPDSTAVGPNKGGKLGKTLAVTISESNTTSGGQTKPTGASVTTTSLTLTRTDKDFDRFNFNYDKVQLPYYNDVGTGNYTGNRVVTGWKITAITAVANDPYTAANYDYTKTYAANPGYFEYPNYNFADRKSSNKDLYTVSKRVFSQGAYFDVPYGVTAITIEPYWANAIYVADQYFDVVYKNDYEGKQGVSQTGTQVNNNTQFNNQSVKTSITGLGSGTTVYDNAVVLVGNFHLNNVPSGTDGTTPFTMMSVDMDNDHEPDYTLIYHHKSRTAICPIRFDFLAVPGTAQAQKPNGASLVCNFTIFKTRGWFEVTNTAFMYSNQLEYENSDGVTKSEAPLILLGGIFEQFVSTQKTAVSGKTIYLHLGGNLWIDQFGMGTHSDGSYSTPHVPVSVTGGDYEGFYLTGTYNKDATVKDDNAECYISSGHFGEVAGAAQEQIGSTNNGNVRWQIYNADIDNFFGGGVNDAKPVQGNIITEIFNSHVGVFCGGPKFGNMKTGKTVTTTAEGCTFTKFFGAGYGGLSYSRKKYYDERTPAWGTTLQGYYITDRGKYFDGFTTNCRDGGAGNAQYGKKGPGVATDFDYEFFVWSSGQTGGRFFVKFASFSLAQCNDVESTLKHCTINGNYYGGGNLGKVTGTVTSELEDCIVNGNAYGAGFSATLPTIWVRDAGFKQKPDGTGYYLPSFNSSSGMFEPGVFSDSTEFTWKQVANYPSEGGAGFDGTQVITTTSLEKTDLGSVGAVSLTIKGESTINGDVFGGGQESVVSGNTAVTLQGKTIVSGNVFGGGDQGTVGGNATVTIEPEPEPEPEPAPESPNQD